MHRGQARSLARPVKPSKLMVAQRQISVSPFDIRTCTLEHLRELFGLLSQGALGLGAQRTQGAARFEQWRSKVDSQLPKWLAMADRATLSNPFEIKRWNELSMQSI